MQRIASSSRSHRQRGTAVHRSTRSSTPATVRDLATVGVSTLARQSGQCLPTLGNTPTEYSHEMQAELLFDLCSALVRCGIATPSHWKQSGGSGNLFVQHAIKNAITEARLALLERNIEYYLNITDVIDRFGDERAFEANELVVLITSGNCGYLEIGGALEALEKEEKGLGAAFYWHLTHSLYRVMRIYDHTDAFEHEERLKEYAESDDEEPGQSEFPEVEKGLPECIRTTLKADHTLDRLGGRRLLLKHRMGKFGVWIEKLRKIQGLTRLQRRAGKDLNESGYYDSPPLPSLLIAFKQHDVVTACFDEESQYMMESSPEPALSVVFSPRDAAEVERTRHVVTSFIAINCELFELVEAIQQLC
jgi:hypothetical protein